MLILLDINMPVMKGFEFLEAYAQLPQGQRDAAVVLMLTTSLNPQDAARLVGLPAAGFIPKLLMIRKFINCCTTTLATLCQPPRCQQSAQPGTFFYQISAVPGLPLLI